jgi:hypothetical protein
VVDWRKAKRGERVATETIVRTVRQLYGELFLARLGLMAAAEGVPEDLYWTTKKITGFPDPALSISTSMDQSDWKAVTGAYGQISIVLEAIEKDASKVSESMLTETVHTVTVALEVLDKLGATKLPAPRLS